MAGGWGVYSLSGSLVFDVDSCVDLKFSNKAKVSTFPVEQGAFASYNKVNVPNSVKVRLAVGGQDRIAAELEEIIVQADMGQIEDAGENF